MNLTNYLENKRCPYQNLTEMLLVRAVKSNHQSTFLELWHEYEHCCKTVVSNLRNCSPKFRMSIPEADSIRMQGLLLACREFDEYRGVKFKNYVFKRMKELLLNEHKLWCSNVKESIDRDFQHEISEEGVFENVCFGNLQFDRQEIDYIGLFRMIEAELDEEELRVFEGVKVANGSFNRYLGLGKGSVEIWDSICNKVKDLLGDERKMLLCSS